MHICSLAAARVLGSILVSRYEFIKVKTFYFKPQVVLIGVYYSTLVEVSIPSASELSLCAPFKSVSDKSPRLLSLSFFPNQRS